MSRTLSMLPTQIGLDHLGVGLDRLLRSGRKNLAIARHRDDVADGEDDIHVVLDEHDGQARWKLVDEADQVHALAWGSAGRRLVHEKDFRLGAKRYRDLQLAFLPVREFLHLAMERCIQMHLFGHPTRLADDLRKARRWTEDGMS